MICLWRISVTGYGDFLYVGTEEEAEDMRAHKARWEGGIAKKVRLNPAGPAHLKQYRKGKKPFAPDQVHTLAELLSGNVEA